jgi:DNA-binding transcriptional LysR family regulator
MRISLRHFRLFVATAETGQFSRAAAALSTSQPVVTEAIKALEAEIGIKLFQRHPKGVTLTYEGSIFLQHARGVLAAVEDAMQAPQLVRRDMAGELTLACTHTVAGYFLPPLLSRFRRLFPGITVTLVELDHPAIEQGIAKGEIELALCLASPLQRTDRIEIDVLARSKRRLWLPANHRLAERKSVGLAEIRSEPYILLTVDDAEKTAMRFWHRFEMEPNIIFRTTSMESIRNLVATGFGVTILSDMVYRPWSLEGARLLAVALSDPIPSMEIALVWRLGAELGPAATAFANVCRQTYPGASPVDFHGQI